MTATRSSLLALVVSADEDGTRRAVRLDMTTQPNKPNEAEPSSTPGQQPASPVNPDPGAHPIHAPIPVQPIHEGTEPQEPVAPGGGGVPDYSR